MNEELLLDEGLKGTDAPFGPLGNPSAGDLSKALAVAESYTPVSAIFLELFML
jgi:hypothetical protein